MFKKIIKIVLKENIWKVVLSAFIISGFIFIYTKNFKIFILNFISVLFIVLFACFVVDLMKLRKELRREI